MDRSPHHQESNNTFTFESPHPVYALAFSPAPPLLALGSFLEDPTNRIDVLSFNPSSTNPSSSSSSSSDSSSSPPFAPSLSFPHPYPPTKLMFHPTNPSLLASSSDFLRLWSLSSSSSSASSPPLRSLLNNTKASDFCAPLTSFDWNPHDPRRIATSSIDTTCTVWDVERSCVDTQLIAHDKEVYDIAWGEAGVFASVSADGSVRIFDLRDKEHSTIVYESPRPDTPLLRLAWNRMDLRYMATILMDSGKVVVLDIRAPAMPVAELDRHRGSVNAIAWAPRTARHICSGGDDGQALIWELPTAAGTAAAVQAASPADGIDPVLGYSAGAEINQLQWSAGQPDWIGIAFANKVQLLRV